MNTIDAKSLKIGDYFSAPVFFDDGVNMFLAELKSVKMYHIKAIERWHIKTLLTFGEKNATHSFDVEELEEVL